MIACADLNKVNTYQEVKLHHKMVSGCESRGFDELLGYVDFKVLSIVSPNLEVQTEPIYQSLSICNLELANSSQIDDFNAILSTLQSSTKDKFSSELTSFSQIIAQAESTL